MKNHGGTCTNNYFYLWAEPWGCLDAPKRDEIMPKRDEIMAQRARARAMRIAWPHIENILS